MDQRILGALMEKQVTVPASYPLTLNALRAACNQQSSREPVTTYEGRELEVRLRELKQRGLIRIVWADRGPRTLKYHQVLEEVLDVSAAEKALLTVLLLRGPQTPGELKARTDRLHGFADRTEVELTLATMAARPEPWVQQLSRQAGQHDNRWVQLLGGADQEPESAAPAAADREIVVAGGAEARDARVLASYDAAAAAYAAALIDGLDRKPFDRWLLDRVAAESPAGPIVDVGCGPGHVAGHLAGMGIAVTGIDVSPAMVQAARSRFPGVTFEVGDLRRILRPPTTAGWSGLTAWYALGHLAPSELGPALAALSRVLVPGGVLALAMHAGDSVQHADEIFGEPVDLDIVLHDPAGLVAAVHAAGLVDVEWFLRSPYPGEAETERLYVWARMPT